MGYHLRPVAIVIICALVVCLLIGVSVVSYNIKQNSYSSSLQQVQNVSDVPVVSSASDAGRNSSNDVGAGKMLTKPCNGPEWKCNIRLDSNVYPVHYDLYLYPRFQTGVFTGRVSIELNITATTDHIRLHTKNLSISSSMLSRNESQNAIPIKDAFEEKLNEYWVVELESPLTEGIYKLSLSFEGSLTGGIVGFYRSQYTDPIQNKTKFVVSSKFQPTYARKAFPCFDEPSFKSTFGVSLVKPSELVALSNMPVIREEESLPEMNLTTVYFQRSVPMVTYLVVFAIGEFSYRSGVTKSGIPVRIYSTSFKVEHTEYAAKITPKIIDFYEEYFGVKYPLPKLDIIGVPDFVSGAMEHWGLISFREVNLLFQPGVGSPQAKKRICSVISHELAHMWFGNLVTLQWWNDLWLNEGFASYMEYEGVNSVHPDWDIRSQFVSDDLTGVLLLDGQLSSHAIVQPVSHPNQITEIFDFISYSKGASVIRMLEHFMGPKNFQNGISKFLKKYAFKNAITENLWETLQSEAPRDVNISFVMDTWTRQMGYPLLRISSRLNQTDVISVTQERFLEDPNSKSSNTQVSPFGFKWEIPLLVSTSVGPSSTQLVWLPQAHKSVDINITADANWVKINTGQLGYFRVKYDSKILKSIGKDYGSKFSPEERCGLVDDVLSLAFSNYTSYADALEFGLQIAQENHVVPWACIFKHLKKLQSLLHSADANAYGYYRHYMHELAEVQYKRLEWTDAETDPHLDRLLKPKIFSLSCEEGIGDCRIHAKFLFMQWVEGNYTVPTNLRSIVYKWGVWQSNETIWNIVWDRYLRETDAAEKVALLQATAFSQEPWIISRLLEYGTDEKMVRQQDYFNMLKYIASNPAGNPVVWNYYRNNWVNLVKRFGINERYLGRVIKDLTSDYCSDVQLQELGNFYKMYPEGGAGTRARESAYENVQNNILWTQRSLPAISTWLKSRYSSIS